MSDYLGPSIYADVIAKISEEGDKVAAELDKCLKALGVEPQPGWTIWRRLVALRSSVERQAKLIKYSEGYRQNAEANLKGLRKAQRRHKKALADFERLRSRREREQT